MNILKYYGIPYITGVWYKAAEADKFIISQNKTIENLNNRINSLELINNNLRNTICLNSMDIETYKNTIARIERTIKIWTITTVSFIFIIPITTILYRIFLS